MQGYPQQGYPQQGALPAAWHSAQDVLRELRLVGRAPGGSRPGSWRAWMGRSDRGILREMRARSLLRRRLDSQAALLQRLLSQGSLACGAPAPRKGWRACWARRSTCLGRHLRPGWLLGRQQLALTQCSRSSGYPQQQYPPQQGGYPPQYGGPPPQQQARRKSSTCSAATQGLQQLRHIILLTAMCVDLCSRCMCSSRSRGRSRTGAAWRPGACGPAPRLCFCSQVCCRLCTDSCCALFLCAAWRAVRGPATASQPFSSAYLPVARMLPHT